MPSSIDPMDLADMPVHPAADVMPMISDAELDKLAEDIKTHGQCEPILVWQGQIIDGRNRRRACALAGVPPRGEELNNLGGQDPAAWVASRNIHRRHLRPAQRAMLLAALEGVRRAAAGRPAEPERAAHQPDMISGRSPDETTQAAVTQDDLREIAQVPKRSQQRANVVVQKGISALQDMVSRNEVGLQLAERVARLPEGDQERLCEEGKEAMARAVRREEEAAQDEIERRGAAFADQVMDLVGAVGVEDGADGADGALLCEPGPDLTFQVPWQHMSAVSALVLRMGGGNPVCVSEAELRAAPCPMDVEIADDGAVIFSFGDGEVQA